jgi:hypothetical protein
MKIKLQVPLLNKIKHWLKNYPELRDSDEKLYIWALKYYHPELRSANMSFLMFAYKFEKGEYLNFETVRRTRQRVQEEFPATRGILYEKRRKNVAEVKEALSAPEMKAGGTP